MCSGVDITWSSMEKDIQYSKVVWSVDKNGIPKYVFLDKDGNKMDINDYIK